MNSNSNNDIYSTSRGEIISSNNFSAYGGPEGADVNDSGAVVFQYRPFGQPNNQIVLLLPNGSIGFITPPTVNAIDPAINDSGEIVWSEQIWNDPGVSYYYAIFSSTLGQLADGTYMADEPDISNNGTIVFRGVSGPDGAGIYEIAAPATPLPATLSLFATGLGAFGLLGWRRKRKARAIPA